MRKELGKVVSDLVYGIVYRSTVARLEIDLLRVVASTLDSWHADGSEQVRHSG